MQNKCNCGCQTEPVLQSFVPVNGNWDFNVSSDCSCQQNNVRRSRRNSCGCDECGQNYTRSRERENNDCQCERCDDSRTVECCDQNTYVRDMDDCECNRSYGQNRSGDCDECTGAYNRSRSACDDDCQCETCTRTRSRSNDCDECNGSYTRNRSGSNGCEKNCSDESAYNRRRSGCCSEGNGYACQSGAGYSRKNRTVGMINVEMQEIDEIFESESALRAGTLFPELHKPMNGYCPCDENCGTCKQAAAFAAWEMRLYLNTHPNDKEALALFRKLCKEAAEENYATTFLTDECCANGWSWVNNPWPWEYDCQCGEGRMAANNRCCD